MNTTAFGPPSWRMMGFVAAGFDMNDTPVELKKRQYATFFRSLGDVLSCRYCRESYKVFFDSLDIDKYMELPNYGLLRFCYDLKNLVNNKLVKQEEKALKEEFKKLSKTLSPNDPKFWEQLREKAHKICYTKPAPAFEEYVDEIMKHRAGCSAKMKTCRAPVPAQFPSLPEIDHSKLERDGPTDADLYKNGGKRKRSLKQRKSTSRKRKSLKHSRRRRA